MATDSTAAVDWTDLSRRLAYGSHRLVGWIFWDPRGVAGYEALGVPNGIGYYIATRGAPLAAAGDEALTAAFGSIHRDLVRVSLELARQHTTFDAIIDVRNAAVAEGLPEYVPDVVAPLADFTDELWQVADDLPAAGRVLFAAHRQVPRPQGASALSTWLALNVIREWRGDTHWMLQVVEDLSMTAAMVLDAAWRGYDDWLPRSRGSGDAELQAAALELTDRGLMTDGQVNDAGLALRQHLEDRLDALTAEPWRRLGWDRSLALLDVLDRAGDRLMARVDATVGPLWMPAGRPRKVNT